MTYTIDGYSTNSTLCENFKGRVLPDGFGNPVKAQQVEPVMDDFGNEPVEGEPHSVVDDYGDEIGEPALDD